MRCVVRTTNTASFTRLAAASSDSLVWIGSGDAPCDDPSIWQLNRALEGAGERAQPCGGAMDGLLGWLVLALGCLHGAAQIGQAVLFNGRSNLA